MKSISNVRAGILGLVVVAGATLSLAFARQDADKPRPKREYLNQEVEAGAMALTMNELDGQGWDIFQIVPVWKVEGAGGDASLVPKAYHVFGRRTVGGFR